MTVESLQRAKDIETEMQKLQSENNMLLEYAEPKRPEISWEKIRPIKVFTKVKNKLSLKKSRYGYLEEEICFDLTKDDIDLLFNHRLKKYHRLKQELEELK